MEVGGSGGPYQVGPAPLRDSCAELEVARPAKAPIWHDFGTDFGHELAFRWGAFL